jgi:pSer/pThr/pTyr-binding forkhead associated (FHA) protein
MAPRTPRCVGGHDRPITTALEQQRLDSRRAAKRRGLACREARPQRRGRFLLDRPVTSAGRHAESDIVLDDITVSQQNAEFRRENRKFQVVDVDSFDGTYVNRELVDSAVLANGDEIQMGKFRLVFLTARKTA